jgi:hypothetical protein
VYWYDPVFDIKALIAEGRSQQGQTSVTWKFNFNDRDALVCPCWDLPSALSALMSKTGSYQYTSHLT